MDADQALLIASDQRLLRQNARYGVTLQLSTTKAGDARIQCCAMEGVVENGLEQFTNALTGRAAEEVGVFIVVARITDSSAHGERFYCYPGGGMSSDAGGMSGDEGDMSGDGGLRGSIFDFSLCPLSLDWGSGSIVLPPGPQDPEPWFLRQWRSIDRKTVEALASANRIDCKIPVSWLPTEIRVHISGQPIASLKELVESVPSD